ncbi:MAG: phosphatase PAP2 family protein [Halanaerobium sp.]
MIKKIDQKLFFVMYDFTVSHEFISKLAVFITKFFPKFFSLIYFIVGGWLIYTGNFRLRAFILIPAAVYLLVKSIPIFYNRRRPFAELVLQNLVNQKEDHSFPSTHTASSMIISLVILNISFELGILMIVLAFLTALSRIMVGVHYPTDILGGWLIAMIFYFFGINILI